MSHRFNSRGPKRSAIGEDGCPIRDTRSAKWLAIPALRIDRTYAVTKSAIRHGVTAPMAADERRFLEHSLPIWISNEMKERVLAVLSKK